MKKLTKKNSKVLNTVEVYGDATLCTNGSRKCGCDDVNQAYMTVNDSNWEAAFKRN